VAQVVLRQEAILLSEGAEWNWWTFGGVRRLRQQFRDGLIQRSPLLPLDANLESYPGRCEVQANLFSLIFFH
jgi:hypothetical protein